MKRIKEFIVSENPPTNPNVGWISNKNGAGELIEGNLRLVSGEEIPVTIMQEPS